MIIKSIVPMAYEGMYKVSSNACSSFYVRQEYLNTVKIDSIESGAEFNEVETDEILDAGLTCVVELKAVEYLARAEQCKFGLCNKLRAKKFEKKYIDNALSYLESKNYLSDKRFATACPLVCHLGKTVYDSVVGPLVLLLALGIRLKGGKNLLAALVDSAVVLDKCVDILLIIGNATPIGEILLLSDVKVLLTVRLLILTEVSFLKTRLDGVKIGVNVQIARRIFWMERKTFYTVEVYNEQRCFALAERAVKLGVGRAVHIAAVDSVLRHLTVGYSGKELLLGVIEIFVVVGVASLGSGCARTKEGELGVRINYGGSNYRFSSAGGAGDNQYTIFSIHISLTWWG